MALKLVSTLIFNERTDEVKCEIYQEIAGTSFKFIALLYVRRKVLMKINVGHVSMGGSDAPDHKHIDSWVIARVIKDIEDTTLESAETSLEQRYMNESFFIPSFFDSTSF